MKIVIVASFLNEEWCLPTFLGSVARQSRLPDLMVLVDDGSTDSSGKLAEDYASGRPNVMVLHRPPRPPAHDRLAEAGELKAFQWALSHVDLDWDVVAKMDADLDLAPNSLETLEQAFASDAALGLAGLPLSERNAKGELVVVASPLRHVRGATKFYRRACWEQIGPLPEILGWDTLDEFLARRSGWRTQSFSVPRGETVHLRRVGGHGPILRSFRRWGVCSWGYGAHPLYVLLYGFILMRQRRPYLIGGVNFMIGWAAAALRRAPRADASIREALRRDQLARIRGRLVRRPLLDSPPQPIPGVDE